MRPYSFILLFCVINLTTFSQVGVNTDNPSQALDVEGQIQVGQDNSAVNEEGTIRYNSADQDFEGFTGTDWESFTENSSMVIPNNAVPITGKAVILSSETGAGNQPFTFVSTETGLLDATELAPFGKKFIITSIIYRNLEFSNAMNFAIGPLQSTILDSNRRIFVGEDANNKQETWSFYSDTPILILKGTNQRFGVSKFESAEVSVRGWMIDE